MKKLALYIHIPFCVQKCLYCDFLSAPADTALQAKYTAALVRELDDWSRRLKGQYEVVTVFLGGGTPTALAPERLDEIGRAVKRFQMESAPEYTVEANPGTVTEGHMESFKRMGVNRISLGLQSAQNGELRKLGRIHTYETFLACYQSLRQQGFHNINVDLMADIPGQTYVSYQDTLKRVLALQPEHISSYSLIIEEGTPYAEMRRQGRLEIPSEETDRRMYHLTRERLAQDGYQRYEISNYAKEGYACRHNQTYWNMGEYLGVGLGAASYLNGSRFSNVRDLKQYLSGDPRTHIAESHRLSRREEMEEFVFLGLRQMRGISLQAYSRRFDRDFHQVYRDVLPRLMQGGLLAESQKHDTIYLTERGIDVSNAVLAEFLLDDE